TVAAGALDRDDPGAAGPRRDPIRGMRSGPGAGRAEPAHRPRRRDGGIDRSRYAAQNPGRLERMMDWSLEGQIALVTGATRGIGAAIADQLASLGAIVVGTATTADGQARIGERLGEYDARCRGAVLDVND